MKQWKNQTLVCDVMFDFLHKLVSLCINVDVFPDRWLLFTAGFKYLAMGSFILSIEHYGSDINI